MLYRLYEKRNLLENFKKPTETSLTEVSVFIETHGKIPSHRCYIDKRKTIFTPLMVKYTYYFHIPHQIRFYKTGVKNTS